MRTLWFIAAVALLGATACNKDTSGGAAVSATPEAPGQVLPEFSSSDPAYWVNGAPSPLASLRGSVVLIESWHPA